MADTRTEPNTQSSADDLSMPKVRHPLYDWAVQSGHRLQIALARRSGPRESWQGGVRILTYHRVAASRDQIAVTPQSFHGQMEMMLEMGAEPIPLGDVPQILREGGHRRYVCVTFDDGYHDNLTDAVPVLRDLKIPATIFIATGIIDGRVRMSWYAKQPRLLSWSDVLELDRDELISIGAHSHSHPALPNLTDDAAWSEIAGCKKDLEARLGREVTSFAYPAGLQGEREERLVREAGYRVAVTTQPGLNLPGHPLETLHRSIIDRRDNEAMFAAKLTGLLDKPWGLDTVRSVLPGLPSRSNRPR